MTDLSDPVIIGRATLYRAHCLDILRTMADCSIGAVVTDPPYELGFSEKAWDKSGIAFNVALYVELLRVLKPGGYLLAFGHARTCHRLVCAIEDGGFEIVNQIMWLYGQGKPKSSGLAKLEAKAKQWEPDLTGTPHWDGMGYDLKPAHEPICMAQKPIVGPVYRNVMTHGTGMLNIGTNRLPCGRWPANVITDGSSAVLNALPDAPGQIARAKNDGSTFRRGIFNGMRNVTALPEPRIDQTKSAARFFFCAKPSRIERHLGLRNPGAKVKHGATMRQVSKASSSQDGNFHPTVKPIMLMRHLIGLVTPPGDVVLDPFMGSATTLMAALSMPNMRCIGIENDPRYFEIACARTTWAHADALQREEASSQIDLFSDQVA